MPAVVLLLLLAAVIPSYAGQAGTAPADGPAAPALPATIARDASGRVTARAVRLSAPLRVDGRLDESVYRDVLPMDGFLQIEPSAGQPPTQKTEVWVLFDQDNVYVSARCWEASMDRAVRTEMRHDNPAIYATNDAFGFAFDTFYDRRNGFLFETNMLAARAEGQFTNERQFNADWNGVWDVKVGKFEGGWSIEAAVPFKSLRYQPGRTQVWSFNILRKNFWKNEISFLTKIPPEKGPGLGMMMMSRAATLVGIEAPERGPSLDLKPYVIGSDTRDVLTNPRGGEELTSKAGVDLKYGVTQNLAADLTYNTDFAQVEADEQQINLTRFSLFFPEKREFFLENAGLFAFGGSLATTGANTGDTPVMFYSRRIGLKGTREIPLRGGGRLTGRVGRFNLGVMDIHSGDEPAVAAVPTNFAAVRLKRDILRRSAIGFIYTGRSLAESGTGRNDLMGADATLSFFNNVNINTYWAKTWTRLRGTDDVSYRAQFDYPADRYGVQLEHMLVGANFNPEIGFVRRQDIRRDYAQLRFSPRPRASRVVRKLWFIGSGTYIENGAGRLDTRLVEGEFDIDFHSSDKFVAVMNRTHELLARPFRIIPAVAIPAGPYDYHNARVTYTFGQQRRVAGALGVERGTFYNGNRTVFSVSAGRVKIATRMSAEPTASVNRVSLVQGSFTTTLVGTRATYAFSPLMFISALVQYNSTAALVSSNVRLRWEYRPGSELFVVYNDARDTSVRGASALQTRSFVVKINRLLRF